MQSNNESGLCVSASSSLTISSDIKSLFISAESTTILSGDISIAGDIKNNGTLNANSGSLTINGGSDQVIHGTGNTSFNNLVLNKTSGDLIMNTPLTVVGNLNLTSGIIQNGNNIIQNFDEFTLHCYSDCTWISYTHPLNWNGNNYANYRGTYLLNSNHTECSFTTTHFNFNDGNGWVDNGPTTTINLFSMELSHSSYSGSLISSTDTTLNSFDFSFVRVE